MASDFEDRLNQADSAHRNLKVRQREFLAETYVRNEPARVEAARRLDALGASVRNFLTAKNIPTATFTYRTTGFWSTKPKIACTGWNLFPHVITSDGRLVEFAERDNRTLSLRDPVRKPLPDGHVDLGGYFDQPFAMTDLRQGVPDAAFMDDGTSETESYFHNPRDWAKFYYGAAYDADLELPGPTSAMMLPRDSQKLYLWWVSDYDGWGANRASPDSFDEMILKLALKFVKKG